MTTYYFIRHAEKEHNGQRNPNLTPKGKKRAQQWAEVLSDKKIEMIYCTPLVRTQETASPLRKKLGLEINFYDLTDLYSPDFQEKTKGKTVLVVGHQNTTPTFINRIIKERKYKFIKGHNHSNLYKVIVHENSETESGMKNLNF